MQTILVVDDEFGAIEVLAAALEDEGYRVVTAANGRHGLERLVEGGIDLVVLDFMMPLVDGAALGRSMKEQPGLRSVPIVMTSAVCEATVREHFDGYNVFLRKPFRVNILIGQVRRLLASSTSLS